MAVYLALAGDVFNGVLFCAVFFSHEMSWMRSGTELSKFLRLFLPTLDKLLPLVLFLVPQTFLTYKYIYNI